MCISVTLSDVGIHGDTITVKNITTKKNFNGSI